MGVERVLDKFLKALAFGEKDRMPLWVLIYLGFLLLPLGWVPPEAKWLVPTLLSIVAFLALYIPCYRNGATFGRALAIALLGFALTPLNGYANVYLVYSAALMPFALQRFRAALTVTASIVVLDAVE